MPKFYKKSTMQFVTDHWGKDIHEDHLEEMKFLDREDFFVAMMKKDDWILDDQTWNDMEMNRIYCHMERTYSDPGKQMLYNMLRTPIFDENELKARSRIMDYFAHNQEMRDKTGALLYHVGKTDYDGAVSILYKGVPKIPDFAKYTNGLTLAMIISLLSIPFLGLTGLIVAAIFFVVNTVFHNKLNNSTSATMPGVQAIARMLDVAQEMGEWNDAFLEERYLSFLRKCSRRCAHIRKKVGVVGMDSNSDPLLGFLEYFKTIFLVQDRAFLRAIKEIEGEAPVLRVLYRKIGEMDALMSAASFRRGMRRACKPVFVENMRYMKAENMVNPLLTKGVPNSLEIDGTNIVITGSNMSGKSTFLRTVATSAVMAQTFYMVCADSYEASFFNVLTSISPSDDLIEGKSYYMSEAQALLRMVQTLIPQRASLLIIDEIFRGTNPMERVAAASSLLEYLARRNSVVIVATHDIEITSKVQDLYQSFHFGENVTKKSLDFDYKLKKGVLMVPNGIRILEYLGYPEEITKAAYEDTGYVGMEALDPEEEIQEETEDTAEEEIETIQDPQPAPSVEINPALQELIQYERGWDDEEIEESDAANASMKEKKE